MGNSDSIEPEGRNPVPEGKIRICVAGYGVSPNYARARDVAHKLAKENPELYETWYYGPSRERYFKWLAEFLKELPDDSPYKSHKTAPICWLEKADEPVEVKGGRDRLCEWTVETYPDSESAKLSASLLNPFSGLVSSDPKPIQ